MRLLSHCPAIVSYLLSSFSLFKSLPLLHPSYLSPKVLNIRWQIKPKTYGYEPSVTDASKPKKQIYQKFPATLRTSIVIKHLAVLLRLSVCTVMLSGPTEALRWSLNTVVDVKCKFKSGSVSCYPSLFFFITIISASCRLFLLLIKYKLINGLLLLTRHSVERDPLWWTVRVARSIRQPTACPPPPAV